MNEIERAIAEIEGTRFGQDQCHESTMRLAHTALKEKLSRQENAPLTWNDRINQMTVEEKARLFERYFCASRIDVLEDFLTSPYTEGEKK